MKRSRIERKTPLVAKTGLVRGRCCGSSARKPLRARSKKMAKVYVERRVLVADLLAERPVCEFPGCRRRSTEVHEILTRARSGNTAEAILNRCNCLCLCGPHHRFTEDQPIAAAEMGLIRHAWDGMPDCP